MKKLIVLCAILLFASVNDILCQDLYYEQYTTDDGLPSNTIYEIVQDSTGLLWIGSENGLVSFDGEEFERFSDSRLKDNDILELEISSEGHVSFTNLSNQFGRMEEGTFNVIDINFEDFTSLPVTSLDLYTHKGIDYILGMTAEIGGNILLKSQRELICHFEDLDARVHLIEGELTTGREFTGESVKFYSNGKFFDGIDSDEYLSFSFKTAFHVNANQLIFLGEEFACSFKNTRIFERGLEKKLYDVFHYDEMSLFGFEDGLFVLDQKTQEIKSYLREMAIQKFFEDREGNLWISTGEHGLLKLSGGSGPLVKLQNLTTEVVDFDLKLDDLILTTDGLATCPEYPLCENLYSFNGDSKAVLINGEKENAVLGKGFVYKLDKNLASKGAAYKIRDQERPFSPKAGCFYRGSLIYADRKRVHQVTDIKSWSRKELFRLQKTQVIEPDQRQDRLLLGTINGMYEYREDAGLSRLFSKTLDGKSIVTIKLEDDKIFLGTANNGCYIFENSELVDSISTDDGLVTNVVNDIELVDSFVYIASPEGLAQYDLEAREVKLFTEFEGLVDNNVAALDVDDSGRVYISQKNGIVQINSSDFDSKEIFYDLLLKSITVNNEEVRVSEIAALSYQENKIDMEFNYITMQSIGRKRLRYRMGAGEWEFSDGLNIKLPSLVPGTYDVEVMGILKRDIFTKSKIISFKINKPWWQTLWFRLLALCLALGTVYFIVSRRIKRVRAEEATKRDYLQQINAVKDQALQLQMNPHFIFNAMNAIQNFIVRNKEEDAANYLARFARLIRLIFEYSSENVISLEKEIDFVKLYLQLEELRFKKTVRSELLIGEGIDNDKDLLKIPPLLVQPVIENAFKHGLLHKKGGGVLIVEYELVDERIMITIEDNGIGRKAAFELKQDDDSDRPSGLKNIAERLNILNFNNRTDQNSIEIVDLYDNDKPIGTRVVLQIAINENR